MTRLVLSVVLCTYDGAAYLQEQLDSLLCQTRKPDEVVVGDDCSRDGTWPVLQAFEKKAGALGIKVSLVRNERNLGFVGNFTQTLKRAAGDIVLLCDQDDIWHWDKLAVIERRFTGQPELLLLFSNARLVDATGQELRHSLFEALEFDDEERRTVREGGAFDVLLRRSIVTGATAAFRRHLLEIALPVGKGWIHDEWLALIAAVAGRVEMIEDPLIDYRQHDRNQIGMRKRTLGDKWADLVRPRQEQFVSEAARLESLGAHLSSMPGDYAGPLRDIAHKRDHFQRRVALGRLSRWARLSAVMREAWSGDYRRYGTGGRSMLRDLMRRG